MPDQREFTDRQEVADLETVFRLSQEGGGRRVVLLGNGQKRRVVQPLVEADDDGWVAAEGSAGEGIDLEDRQLHAIALAKPVVQRPNARPELAPLSMDRSE